MRSKHELFRACVRYETINVKFITMIELSSCRIKPVTFSAELASFSIEVGTISLNYLYILKKFRSLNIKLFFPLKIEINICVPTNVKLFMKALVQKK